MDGRDALSDERTGVRENGNEPARPRLQFPTIDGDSRQIGLGGRDPGLRPLSQAIWTASGRHHSELAEVSGDRFWCDTTPQAAPVQTFEIRAVDLAFLHGLGRLRTVGTAQCTRLLPAEQLEGFVRRSYC